MFEEKMIILYLHNRLYSIKCYRRLFTCDPFFQIMPAYTYYHHNFYVLVGLSIPWYILLLFQCQDKKRWHIVDLQKVKVF